jgi:hypothetical protein
LLFVSKCLMPIMFNSPMVAFFHVNYFLCVTRGFFFLVKPRYLEYYNVVALEI